MNPENLLSLKFRIIPDILDHEPDQIQKFLSADEQMHSHHHIKMADELSRIISLTLELKEFHQSLSGLIFDLDSFPEILFLKLSSETVFQFLCEVFQLVRQIIC